MQKFPNGLVEAHRRFRTLGEMARRRVLELCQQAVELFSTDELLSQHPQLTHGMAVTGYGTFGSVEPLKFEEALTQVIAANVDRFLPRHRLPGLVEAGELFEAELNGFLDAELDALRDVAVEYEKEELRRYTFGEDWKEFTSGTGDADFASGDVTSELRGILLESMEQFRGEAEERFERALRNWKPSWEKAAEQISPSEIEEETAARIQRTFRHACRMAVLTTLDRKFRAESSKE